MSKCGSDRKIIQIQIAAQSGVLVALCDDGTLWERLPDGWRAVVPLIPQD
jgi:hypothetical protein